MATSQYIDRAFSSTGTRTTLLGKYNNFRSKNFPVWVDFSRRVYSSNADIPLSSDNASYQQNKLENRVQQLIDTMDSPVRPSYRGGIDVKECKLCDKGNRSNVDNLWKLRVNTNGSYYCFRCSKGGSYYKLKNIVHGANISTATVVNDENRSQSPSQSSHSSSTVSISSILWKQDSYKSYSKHLFSITTTVTQSHSDPAQDGRNISEVVQDYLYNKRQLNQETLLRYAVGCAYFSFPDDTGKAWKDKMCVTFPWIRALSDGEGTVSSSMADTTKKLLEEYKGKYIIARVKCRAIDTKGLQKLLPIGGEWGFFGWHLIRDHHDRVIVTEGEYDAMAVSQGLRSLPSDHSMRDIPVISLPNGCGSFPDVLIAKLQRFRTIYLWLDNDGPGIDGCHKLARKLGVDRCLIVRPNPNLYKDLIPIDKLPKDANDALRQTYVKDLIPLLLSQAQSYLDTKLSSIKDATTSYLHCKQSYQLAKGSSILSINSLNKTVNGLRKGELVAVAGQPGDHTHQYTITLSLRKLLRTMKDCFGVC